MWMRSKSEVAEPRHVMPEGSKKRPRHARFRSSGVLPISTGFGAGSKGSGQARPKADVEDPIHMRPFSGGEEPGPTRSKAEGKRSKRVMP